MTDIPALIINFGILLVSGVAALVAVVQARAALRDAGKAEYARDEAVVAQKASAEALTEANRISKETHDLLSGQDARLRERHQVDWRGQWDSTRAMWFLANDGPDAALDVRFTATSGTLPRQTQTHDEIPPGKGAGVEFPELKGTGGAPYVSWRVEWRTPLGVPRSDEGQWPAPKRR